MLYLKLFIKDNHSFVIPSNTNTTKSSLPLGLSDTPTPPSTPSLNLILTQDETDDNVSYVRFANHENSPPSNTEAEIKSTTGKLVKASENSTILPEEDEKDELIKVGFEFPDEFESPLNDFSNLTSQEVAYEYQDPHIKFHVIEPDTGIHGVKMANGHLHLNNQTYNYFDPSEPHKESLHMYRDSKLTYVIIGVFLLISILTLVWAMLKIYK